MAWTTSRTWKVTPSEVYRIDDEYAAYCLDKAVMIWGLAYEADLSYAVNQTKTAQDARRAQAIVMNRWLTDVDDDPLISAPDDNTPPAPPARPQFRDPSEAFAKVRSGDG